AARRGGRLCAGENAHRHAGRRQRISLGCAPAGRRRNDLLRLLTTMPSSLAARTLARPSFEKAFAPASFLRAMLAFESALARAQADEGIIAQRDAETIASACATIVIDMEALVAEGKRNASLAVPFVKTLRDETAKRAGDASKHVHFGATSQD